MTQIAGISLSWFCRQGVPNWDAYRCGSWLGPSSWCLLRPSSGLFLLRESTNPIVELVPQDLRLAHLPPKGFTSQSHHIGGPGEDTNIQPTTVTLPLLTLPCFLSQRQLTNLSTSAYCSPLCFCISRRRHVLCVWLHG